MEALTYLKEVKKRLSNYDPLTRVVELLGTDSVQQQIIDLIQNRIKTTGTLSDGEKLVTDSGQFEGTGSYSINNPKIRTQSHVDLFDTAEFFNQWELTVTRLKTKVKADKINKIQKNFEWRFGSPQEMIDALGTLSPQEIEYIAIDVILPYLEQDLDNIFNV